MFSFLACRRDGYHVTLVRDAAAAVSIDRIHAAHELNGPNFALVILTTAESSTGFPPLVAEPRYVVSPAKAGPHRPGLSAAKVPGECAAGIGLPAAEAPQLDGVSNVFHS